LTPSFIYDTDSTIAAPFWRQNAWIFFRSSEKR